MRTPENIREKLTIRYARHRFSWLANEGSWPLNLSLGCPREEEGQRAFEQVQTWVVAWRAWQGPGQLVWQERRWRVLGTQRLPTHLVIQSPEDVATWLGERARWCRALDRYRQLVADWPALHPTASRHFDMLAAASPTDFARLKMVLAWLIAHPRTNLYPRQLPIAGVDSKWIEENRPFIGDLVRMLKGELADTHDFYQLCGLRPLPLLVRIRVLDPQLRRQLGSFGDLTVPVLDLAELAIDVPQVLIVENLQTGLALEDLCGTIAIMGLGNNVTALASLRWLQQKRCMYWGDIDTHGFAILHNARAHLPQLESLLMDAQTLLDHRSLWGEEGRQYFAAALPRLAESEHAVYLGLKQQQWGTNVRLEQERIGWDYAWPHILTKCGAPRVKA